MKSFNSKFWARNRPGDTMRDKYNQYLLPNEEVTGATNHVLAMESENNNITAANVPLPGEFTLFPGITYTLFLCKQEWEMQM